MDLREIVVRYASRSPAIRLKNRQALLIMLIWQYIRVLGAEIVNIEGSGSMAIDKLDRLP